MRSRKGKMLVLAIALIVAVPFGMELWLEHGAGSLDGIGAAANGQFEGPGAGGWSQVKKFKEVVPFDHPAVHEQELHSVWRIVRHPVGRPEETAYLYIASDESTALLGTFRP
jgi:hypothetical protein